MKLKILFLLIYSSTLSCSFNELSQLSNTLLNLAQKNLSIISSETDYTDLHQTLIEVCKTEDCSLFDKYPNLKTLLTFMFKEEYRIYRNDSAIIILSLIQTYEQILKVHKPETELYIASLAGSILLLHERLLLHALVDAGYNKITFYSIDPESPKTLLGFENQHEFANIKYRYFEVAQDYIKDVIKIENELPHVCMIITPGTPFLSGRDFNYFGINNEQEMLITPQTLDEISILISPKNQDHLTALNNKLANLENSNRLSIITSFDPTIHPLMLKFKGTNKMGQYGLPIFHESVIVDFLELLKLASSSNRDCIACNCCRFKALDGHRTTGPLHLVNYKNIAEQSTALLFKRTLLYPNDWKTYIYNKNTNQFEVEKIV